MVQALSDARALVLGLLGGGHNTTITADATASSSSGASQKWRRLHVRSVHAAAAIIGSHGGKGWSAAGRARARAHARRYRRCRDCAVATGPHGVCPNGQGGEVGGGERDELSIQRQGTGYTEFMRGRTIPVRGGVDEDVLSVRRRQATVILWARSWLGRLFDDRRRCRRSEGVLDGVDNGGGRDEESGGVRAQYRVRDDFNVVDGGGQVSKGLSRVVPL